MSEQNQVQSAPEEKTNTKEYNFRAMEAKLAEADRRRIEAERRAEEAEKKSLEVDEEDDEPYVDKKKLKKHLNQFGQESKQETKSEIQKAMQQVKEEARREAWLENKPDFYETLNTHAEKLAKKDPELARSILAMPESFERQKLVYQNIKALGLDKPEQKEPSVQEKIDANRRSPYYQPSQMGTAPYVSQGDFSQGGQKQAYEKMQALKKALRI